MSTASDGWQQVRAGLALVKWSGLARFKDDPELENLYVSVFHVEPFKPGGGRSRLLRAYTRYVEDLIYWEYTRRFGRRAALDYKKGKSGP